MKPLLPLVGAALATALLVTPTDAHATVSCVVDPRDVDDEEAVAPSLIATVAPRDAGAVALVGGTF